MKNLFLMINPENPDITSIQFGCYLAKNTQSRLTGLFLGKRRQEVPALEMAYGVPYVETVVAGDLPGYEQQIASCKRSMEQFQKMCEVENVKFNIRQIEFSIDEVTAETRFADLVILSRDISPENDHGPVPSDFVKDILSRTECPVLVAPLTFDRIEEILLAYDESRSSAFAIKQFTYLIPEMEDLKITMLHVRKDPDEDEFQRDKLSQWATTHYSYPVFKIMIGNPGSELYKHLFNKKKTLVIMGSYGRGAVSSLLQPSTADSLLENLDLPFFFAHH
jgi:hypothetical protein